MATSCALQCMFHNLRKLSVFLTHTRIVVRAGSLSSAWRGRAARGFRQGCLCLVRFGHTGWPRLLCLQTRGLGNMGEFAGCLSRAVKGSHLLCPFPAFHTACELLASVPDWSMTSELTSPPSLSPPHLHAHTHTYTPICLTSAT